jgi:hypothetical protein
VERRINGSHAFRVFVKLFTNLKCRYSSRTKAPEVLSCANISCLVSILFVRKYMNIINTFYEV